MKTHYGVLKASESKESTYTLRFEGKPLGIVKAEGLSMSRVTSTATDPAYVIIDKDLSGLHCRHEFALVKISSPTAAKLSDNFGECMELRGAKLIEGGVTIFLQTPFIEGQQSENEAWSWKNDVMKKTVASTTSASGDFRQYINSKYGFSIDYPSSFIAQGESDAGDGLIFTSPTNDATLMATSSFCYESFNSPAKFIDEYKQEEKAGKLAISYIRSTKKFAVVSEPRGRGSFMPNWLWMARTALNSSSNMSAPARRCMTPSPPASPHLSS
jgi:hypothetical protein